MRPEKVKVEANKQAILHTQQLYGHGRQKPETQTKLYQTKSTTLFVRAARSHSCSIRVIELPYACRMQSTSCHAFGAKSSFCHGNVGALVVKLYANESWASSKPQLLETAFSASIPCAHTSQYVHLTCCRHHASTKSLAEALYEMKKCCARSIDYASKLYSTSMCQVVLACV